MSGLYGMQVYNFLRGTKTSEAMEKNGISKLMFIDPVFSNNIKLSDLIIRNLEGGKSVIISGSAGGGKTSLITNVISISNLSFINIEDILNSAGDEIIIINDLSASALEYGDYIKENFSNRIFLIAGNEGALMNKEYFGNTFDKALDLLHKIKVGISEKIENKLLVIDLPALNPSSYAIKSLLTNEYILESVEYQISESLCCIDEEMCYRNKSLKQLKDVFVVEYISTLVSDALAGHDVLFRDILDWIEDILLNGSCESVNNAPTSAWFWRLFFGKTKISNILKMELLPESSSIIDPVVRTMLVKNDHEKISKITNDLYYYDGSKVTDKNSILWSKIQFLILHNSFSTKEKRNNFLGNYSSMAVSLKAVDYKKSEVIRSINNYFTQNYGGSSEYLNLWCDFSILRTSRKQRNQECVLLGKISSDKLLIENAKVLSFSRLNSPNHEDYDFNVKGGHRFLVFTAIDGKIVTLELTKVFLKSIKNGRPLTYGDRGRDAIDLSIRNFFLKCSTFLKKDSVSAISYLISDGSQLIEKSLQLDDDEIFTAEEIIYE